MSATDNLLQAIQRKQRIYNTYREYRRNGLPMDREVEPFDFGNVEWEPLTYWRMSIVEPPDERAIEVTTERDGFTCLIRAQQAPLHDWARGRGKLLYADEWQEGAQDYPPFKSGLFPWRYYLPERTLEDHRQAFLALGATPEWAKEFATSLTEEEIMLAGGWHTRLCCQAYTVTVYVTKDGKGMATLAKPVEVGGYGWIWRESLPVLGKCTTLALEEALARAKTTIEKE